MFFSAAFVALAAVATAAPPGHETKNIMESLDVRVRPPLSAAARTHSRPRMIRHITGQAHLPTDPPPPTLPSSASQTPLLAAVVSLLPAGFERLPEAEKDAALMEALQHAMPLAGPGGLGLAPQPGQQQGQPQGQPQGQKAEAQGQPQQQSGLSALLRRQQEAQQEQAQQEQAMEEAKEEAAREASLTAAYAEWLSAGASPICSIW